MANVAITLFVVVAIGAGIILLQIYLSKKDSKWLGLILPIITLCISLIYVSGIAAFTETTISGVRSIDENGVVIEEIAPEISSGRTPIKDTPTLIFQIAYVFLLGNIPTIILLAIYFASREKQRRRKALDKMQAQDLE